MSITEARSKLYEYRGRMDDRVSGPAICKADSHPDRRVFPQKGEEVTIYKAQKPKMEVVTLGLRASMLLGELNSGRINKQKVIDKMGGIPFKKIKRMALVNNLRLNERR